MTDALDNNSTHIHCKSPSANSTSSNNNKVIQPPRWFRSFDCYCKHLGEVWKINLIKLCRQECNKKDLKILKSIAGGNLPDIHVDDYPHPATVIAALTYDCSHLPDHIIRNLILEVDKEVIHWWIQGLPGLYPYLWIRFSDIVSTYFDADSPDIDERALHHVRMLFKTTTEAPAT